MIAMPMSGTHLCCFEEWKRLGRVCGWFRPMGEALAPHRSLVFGDDPRYSFKWDNLMLSILLFSAGWISLRLPDRLLK